MRKLLGVFLLLLVALVAVVASDRPLPPADVTIININDQFTLDPQRRSYNHDLRLSYAIYEGLVRWDNESEDFDIVPALARSWDVSPDAMVYTFHLEPTAKWSDGSPVTADDVAFSWTRAMLPDTASDYSGLFFHIEGAEALFDHRAAQLERFAAEPWPEGGEPARRRAAEELFEQTRRFARENVGLEVVDDHTLRVTLERPAAYFLDLVAMGSFSPVKRELVESYTRFDAASGRMQQDFAWTKPPVLVTNGPYVPRVWRFKREMYLERNPHYWDPTLAKADTIRIIPITAPNTAALAFDTGAGDWLSDVTAGYVADMLAEKRRGERSNIHALSTFGTYFWSFNCTPRLADGRANPFADPGVRRAFAMAVDKQSIVDDVKRTGEKVAHVFVPPGSIPGFESPEGLAFDPERARAELAAAGWVDRDGDGVPEDSRGEPFPVVEMLVSTGSYHENVGLAMGRMWQEHLGVKTKLDPKESKIYKDNLKTRDYMVARGGWFGDYGDPTTFLDLHKTGDGNNDRGYSDPVFDDMLARAAEETDAQKRLDILEEAERYTMERTLPILPIWHYNYYYMFEPPTKPDGSPNPGGLRGISYHPRLVQYLWKLEVVAEEEAAP